MKKFFVAAACLMAIVPWILPLAACGDIPAAELPAPPAADGGLPEEELPEEELPEEELPESQKKTAYILVRTDGLNVRTGAGTGHASLGQVHAGELLEYISTHDSWHKTRYRNRTAYVSAKATYTSLTALAAADDAIERVIDEGLALLGTPYVYGAVRYHDGKGNLLKNFTTNAFDCSSLMQYIFYRGAGILLDVTTRTQVKQGTPVAWEHIERGDLLFYTNAQRYHKTGVERIGHVALYLGDNYILHTASDFALIEQMSATRRGYFITARRFL